MKLPTHALNKKNRSQLFTWYRTIHPDAKILSASAIYECVWRWFADDNNLKCLPPPLIVNHTGRFIKSGTYSSVSMFATAYGATSFGDYYGLTYVPKRLFPHLHEIQLYTKAFRKYIHAEFFDRVSFYVLTTILVHFLIHELHHFRDCLNDTLRMDAAVLADDDKTMGELIQQYLDHQKRQSGGDEALLNADELDVEERALADTERFINAFIRDEDDPICTYGTQEYFDLANQEYAEALVLLERMKLESKSIYAPISDAERNELSRRITELTSTLANFNEYKKTRFVVID